MKIKAKIALAGLALLLAAPATIAYASQSDSVLCTQEPTTFNQWFYQLFYC